MEEVPGFELPPVAAPAPPEPVRELTFRGLSFTGTGGEYFKIWIVNLALTIGTLGIYSAWAKVRRLQYFYRHTRLADSGFDYHGNPIAILKGRIVGLILFGMYSSISYVDYRVAIAILVALAGVMPWLLGRSLRFRLHNSSYRGVRFKFHGTTGEAYWVFLGFAVVTILTLFTLGPLWHHRLKRYQFSNAAFGTSRFDMQANVGDFYITYVFAGFTFIGLLVLIVGMFVFGGILIAVANGSSSTPANGSAEVTPVFWVLAVLAGLAYAAAILAVQSIVTARIHNACWNATRTAHHRFESRMSPLQLFRIQYGNFIATIATLGLFRPFALVRLAKYVAGTLTVIGVEGLDVYTAAESEDVTAVGEETASFFDFDIAF